jgi:histidinol dehydrogenase
LPHRMAEVLPQIEHIAPSEAVAVTKQMRNSFASSEAVRQRMKDASRKDTNLTNATLGNSIVTGEVFSGATWSNTYCPDDTVSDNDGGTCVNDLTVPSSAGGTGTTG